MKIHFTSLYIAFFLMLSTLHLQAQVTDTLTLDWESLPGVPNRTIAFAKSGGRIFAVNGLYTNTLFYSDNNGENWIDHPAFEGGVEHVMANDSITLVFTHQITLQNQGYIVINDYAIHRSTDGGATFSEVFNKTYTIVQPSSGGFGVFQGQYISGDFCTAGIVTSGGFGSVNWINFYSTDGGVTWNQGEASAQFTLFADGKWRGATIGQVCESDTPDFANSDCHYTGGSGMAGRKLVGAHWQNGTWYLCTNTGVLYTSSDDGITWEADTLLGDFGYPYGFRFYEGHYFLTCEKGLFRSAGGTPEDWELVFQNPLAHLADCTSFEPFGDEFFLDAFATGVVRSPDGGQTWSVKNMGLTRRPIEKLFKADGEIWGGKYIYLNAGFEPLQAFYILQPDTTWLPLAAPDIRGKHLSNFFFEHNGNVWIQQDYPDFYLLLSNDGGQNWQEVNLPPSFTWYLRKATVDADGRLWFWTEDRAAFTTDLGQSWLEMDIPGSSFNYPQSIVSHANSIIGAGEEGLFRSSDLGQNWQEIILPSTANSYQVFQIHDDSLVYFNGDNGKSCLSEDGGITWTQTGNGFGNATSPGSPVFWLKHENTVMAQGIGKLFITKDFGATWTQVDSVPGIGQPVVLDDYIWFSSFSYTGTWRAFDSELFDSQILPSKEEKVFEKWLEIQVFPNPAGDEVSVSFTLPEAGLLGVKVLDLLGRQVATVLPFDGYPAGKISLKMNTAGWQPSLYFIHFQADRKSLLKKLVKL